MNMSKLIIAAAGLMIAACAQASQPEFTLTEVDMTPLTEVQKPIQVSDARFANYELENIAGGGR
jgi:hypothetical protein